MYIDTVMVDYTDMFMNLPLNCKLLRLSVADLCNLPLRNLIPALDEGLVCQSKY
jgi:hypothetical protein